MVKRVLVLGEEQRVVQVLLWKGKVRRWKDRDEITQQRGEPRVMLFERLDEKESSKFVLLLMVFGLVLLDRG